MFSSPKRRRSGMLLNMRDLTRRTLLLAPAALAAAAETQPVRLPKRFASASSASRATRQRSSRPWTVFPTSRSSPTGPPDQATLRRPANVKRYDDWKAMLDSEKLDVVAITNNNGERAPVIIEAAKRKINVVAEKPLAIDRAGLQAVRTAVEKNGISLGMLLNMRYQPHFLALKKIVSEGTIGEVLQIASQKSYKLGNRAPWFRKTSTYGGSITWVGIHMLDLMRWTSGREFTSVAGFKPAKAAKSAIWRRPPPPSCRWTTAVWPLCASTTCVPKRPLPTKTTGSAWPEPKALPNTRPPPA